MKSSTGLYCGSATEKNWALEQRAPGSIMAISQQFLDECVATPSQERYDFIQNHPVMLSPIKPKGELTSNIDVFKKTRNIVAASAPSQKLA